MAYELDNSVDTQLVGKNMGICPYCKSEDVNYGTSELTGDNMFYPCTCDNCNNEWKEWYTVSFDGNYGFPLKSPLSN